MRSLEKLVKSTNQVWKILKIWRQQDYKCPLETEILAVWESRSRRSPEVTDPGPPRQPHRCLPSSLPRNDDLSWSIKSSRNCGTAGTQSHHNLIFAPVLADFSCGRVPKAPSCRRSRRPSSAKIGAWYRYPPEARGLLEFFSTLTPAFYQPDSIPVSTIGATPFNITPFGERWSLDPHSHDDVWLINHKNPQNIEKSQVARITSSTSIMAHTVTMSFKTWVACKIHWQESI